MTKNTLNFPISIQEIEQQRLIRERKEIEGSYMISELCSCFLKLGTSKKQNLINYTKNLLLERAE